jgi:large repetitive protein
LLKPVIHAAGNNENDATVNLTYQVKDATLPSADTATGTLAITLDDDIPVAAPIIKTVTETSSDTNILLILDRSGSMDFASGVAGYATRLDLLKAAANELLDQYDAAGDVRVQIIKFNDSAQKQGSTWLSVADAKTYINGLSANDGTTMTMPRRWRRMRSTMRASSRRPAYATSPTSSRTVSRNRRTNRCPAPN